MPEVNTYARPGIRTTVTVDPSAILEDIDMRIRELSPVAIPIQYLTEKAGRGPKPTNKKIKVAERHEYDNIDQVTAEAFGTGNDRRFARLRCHNISNPTLSVAYYYPQDKLFIVATSQVVEVVCNERASMPTGTTGATEYTFADTTLTNNTTTRSASGTIVIRALENVPLKSFTTSEVVMLGRTIAESQKIEAESKQSDFLWDTNYVEHKEAVFEMTEDQKNIAKTRIPDWDYQQKARWKEFKVDVEHNLMFSERHLAYNIQGRPTHHMRGLFHAIRTNVSYYDPLSTVDYEMLISNWMYDQVFRWNPEGYNKMGVCGGAFLRSFNLAFRDYRRTSGIGSADVGKEAGLDIETYSIPGGFKLALTRSEVLRQNTRMENWCFAISPGLMEMRLVKDYTSRTYQLLNERDYKIMIEWQGTIAFHLEQAHAMLRTV